MKKEEMGGHAARMRDMIHAHGRVVGNSERNTFFWEDASSPARTLGS
jgi:hypothetical protein